MTYFFGMFAFSIRSKCLKEQPKVVFVKICPTNLREFDYFDEILMSEVKTLNLMKFFVCCFNLVFVRKSIQFMGPLSSPVTAVQIGITNRELLRISKVDFTFQNF